MNRILIVILVMFVLPRVAFCEMPITIVKPDKATFHSIVFSINVVDENLNNPGRFKFQRLVLSVHIQNEDKWRISDPMILVMDGKKFICRAMLDKVGSGYDLILGKKPEGTERYWFEINPDYIHSSSINVNKYPVKPDKNKELCIQSMVYVLELKDYIKRKPNNSFE